MIELYRGWLDRIHFNYPNPIERQRAMGLTLMITGLMALWLVAVVTITIPQLLTGQPIPQEALVVFGAMPFVMFGIHYFVQSSRLKAASYIMLGLLLAGSFSPLLQNLNSVNVIFLGVALFGGAVLLNVREMLVYVVIFNIAAFVVAFNISGETGQQIILTPQVLGHFSLLALASVTMLLFSWAFTSSTEGFVRDAQTALKRFDFMEDFNTALAKARDENGAMIALSDLIVERLLYVHLQIHLFDPQGRLLTYVRTGMGTRYSVTPTDLHTVQGGALKRALDTQKPVVVTSQDSGPMRLHMLPSASNGMVIPLVHQDNVIGVIDVQSSEPATSFSEGEQVLMEIIGREFTASLVTVRERSAMRQVVSERDAALTRLEGQINRLRQELAQTAGSDWRDYLQGRGANAFGYDLQREGMRLTPANDLPEDLLPALQAGEMIVQATPQGQNVYVPIMFRQEVLGAMRFVVPPGQVVTDRQKELAQTVAQRLALALENARLVEQSRAQAEREHTASEVSSLLISQQDIDLLLAVAAESFNEALGAIYTQIHLEPGAEQAFLTRQEQS